MTTMPRQSARAIETFKFSSIQLDLMLFSTLCTTKSLQVTLERSINKHAIVHRQELQKAASRFFCRQK